MYDERSSAFVSCESVDYGHYIIVRKHPASGLISIYEDDRTDLRGYRVKASWSGGDLV